MSLEKIMSISGKPGLFELKNQTRGGFLAESLLDGKKVNVSASQNVSLLSEIAIYTTSEELPLREVFKKIAEKENGGEAINHKVSKDELEEYFFGVLPDYDEDRVYASDIKKVVQWYNLLTKKGLTDFDEPAEETAATKKTKTSAVIKDSVSGKVASKGSQKATSSKKGGAAKSTAARKK